MGRAKGGPVEERDFWSRLEFRIGAEFSGFAHRRLHYYWCDGLMPDEYDLAGTEPRIDPLSGYDD